MSNYAKIEEGIVTNVIVCEDSFISQVPGEHVKVTDSTNIPGVGWEYSKEKNKFKAPQPFESWTLNEETILWEAPVAKPIEEGFYRWDEAGQEWILVS
jgi:hypothetical protein